MLRLKVHPYALETDAERHERIVDAVMRRPDQERSVWQIVALTFEAELIKLAYDPWVWLAIDVLSVAWAIRRIVEVSS